VEYYPLIQHYYPSDYHNPKPLWKVHWWGYDNSEDTWEGAENLRDLTTGGYPMIWLFHHKNDIPLPDDLLEPPEGFCYEDYDEEVEVKVKAEKVEIEERKVKAERTELDRLAKRDGEVERRKRGKIEEDGKEGMRGKGKRKVSIVPNAESDESDIAIVPPRGKLRERRRNSLGATGRSTRSQR
jgi:hypothetical protein